MIVSVKKWKALLARIDALEKAVAPAAEEIGFKTVEKGWTEDFEPGTAVGREWHTTELGGTL